MSDINFITIIRVFKMTIICLGNKKGGVGKSITAVSTAGAIVARAIREGRNPDNEVCILDADTNESICSYIRRREAYSEKLVEQGKEPLPFIKVELRKPDDSLTRDLKALENLYRYVIVDTGGYENKAFKSTLAVADVVYMPFQPSQVDIEQLIPTLFVAKQIEENMQVSVDENFKIDARLLVTKVDHNSKDLLQDAKNTCKQLLPYASISSVTIPTIKKLNSIQNHGLLLSDAEVKHPKRAIFEQLLDEIDGKKSVAYEREAIASDASDTRA